MSESLDEVVVLAEAGRGGVLLAGAGAHGVQLATRGRRRRLRVRRRRGLRERGVPVGHLRGLAASWEINFFLNLI